MIHLDSTVNGVLLVPQQAALDVHVLESECVLGAHQRRQRANQDGKVLRRRQLQVADRQRTIEIGYRFARSEERRSQGRNIVSARLEVELPPAGSLLNKNLSVTQSRLRWFIS